MIGTKVPGGWISTRSVGVRAGPMWAGVRRKPRAKTQTEPWTRQDTDNMVLLATLLLKAVVWVLKVVANILIAPFLLAMLLVRCLWWCVKCVAKGAAWLWAKARRVKPTWAPPTPESRIA